jgi:hypothetical protein
MTEAPRKTQFYWASIHGADKDALDDSASATGDAG